MIVLDHCEHLVDAAATVAEAAGGSRLTEYEAVQLFIDRAFAVQPSFRVSEENAPALAVHRHPRDR